MPTESRSLTISLEEAVRLRKTLLEHGIEISSPRNETELFSAKNGGIEFVVYRSGTLVYRDSIRAEELLRDILMTETGYDFFLGSDEAGKGEWYGPLVVVATAASPETVTLLRRLGVKDSKSLPREAIFRLGEELASMNRLRWKEVVLSPVKYNDLYGRFKSEGKSLNDLLAWAHSAALRDLLANLHGDRAKIVIDEFDASKMDLRLQSVDQDRVTIVQKPRGEEDPMVATASILAKWRFEKEVDKLSGHLLLDLKKSSPGDVPKDRLREVAKLHFQNVSSLLT